MFLTDLSPSDRSSLSFSHEDYLRFARLVNERFGLAFPEKRRAELEIGVRRAFAASTCVDLASYYATLNSPENGALELERLVNHLTIGESHFFRDAGQMDALVNHVLPEIIERKQATRTLRIWSAGCASGEEPYSIAMLLSEQINLQDWSVTILGTDINTLHLERAKRARYGEWAFREDRAKACRARYFTSHDHQYQLRPEICQLVSFGQLNLAEDRFPSYQTNTMFLDLIICRNVTIYFSEEVTRGVVNRFSNALVEGGWLMVGHSEYSFNTYQKFQAYNFPDAILFKRQNEMQKGREAGQGISKPLAKQLISSLPPTSLTGKQRTERQLTSVKKDAALGKSESTPCTKNGDAPSSANEFEQAQTLLSLGQVDRARDLLLTWLGKYPQHAPACALCGKVFADLGNWPEAERWCQIALNLEPLNRDGFYILGLVYQHQGKAEAALQMMKKVIYINRTDILGHFSLANLYHSAGQLTLALKSLENARRILEKLPPGDLVPQSDDILVARLLQTVNSLQQGWTLK